MSLTTTSLTHPTMIAKIRKGLYYAHKGQGHMMNGHGTRVYIENAKGHNVMRLNWVGGRQGYVVLGNVNKDITHMVKEALKRATASYEYPHLKDADGYKVSHTTLPVFSKLPRMIGLAMLGASLTACQSPGAVTVMATFFKGLFG